MKSLIQFSRIFTGILFIFSGLIKLNDPYGFSYKLTEYFEVFSKDISPFFHHFVPFALTLSVLICVAEIVLGIGVLLWYRMKTVSWILLLLILFFTFLTFYSAYFDKVRECGCFGDFIHLTPWESFWKDIFLLLLILLIFFQRNKLNEGYNNLKGDIIVGISAFLCLILGVYSIEHLPFSDASVYATGKNIPEQVKPEEAPRFVYIFEKNGEQVEMSSFPRDPSYKYINFRVLNPEKSQARILDYEIWNDDGRFTDSTFTGRKLFITVRQVGKILEDKEKVEHLKEISGMASQLEKNGIRPIIITSSSAEEIESLRHETRLAIPFYYMDETPLKTMIRSDPGLLYLENGTIKGKWHHNDVPDFETLKTLK
jgi:uncharacterized membrane protein YphA (DoxX/SURF4 family)